MASRSQDGVITRAKASILSWTDNHPPPESGKEEQAIPGSSGVASTSQTVAEDTSDVFRPAMGSQDGIRRHFYPAVHVSSQTVLAQNNARDFMRPQDISSGHSLPNPLRPRYRDYRESPYSQPEYGDHPQLPYCNQISDQFLPIDSQQYQPTYATGRHHHQNVSGQIVNPQTEYKNFLEYQNSQSRASPMPLSHNRGDSRQSFKMGLPQFNGKCKWINFHRQFEANVGNQGWNNDERRNHLLVSISGDTADFVFELSHEVREDYWLLVDELDQRFHVVKSRDTWQQEFYTRKLHTKESTKEFAADLTKLIIKAYPTGLSREARQDMLIKQFFDGIEDGDVYYQVKYLMQPRSLQEAVNKLREYDSYKGINREPVGRQAGNNYEGEDRERRPNHFGEKRQNHYTRAVY